MDHKIRRGMLAQAEVEEGGWYAGRKWLTKEQVNDAENRWARRSYQGCTEETKRETLQCGGCRWFAALGDDFGICYRKDGPFDGMITFEHGACKCMVTS